MNPYFEPETRQLLRAPLAAGALLLSLLLFAPWALTAQEGPSAAAARPAAAEEEETPEAAFGEEIRVRLVTLPVLAQDRRGRPITDLAAEELEVRDGRRRYPVSFLTPFFEVPQERQGLPAVRLLTELPGGPQEVIKPTSREPRYLLILADIENDPPVQRRAAMEALIEFVERELDPSFRVALMSFDGELELRVPFTQDRHAVTSALRRVYTELRPRPRITLELRMASLLQKLELCESATGSSHFNPVADASCLRASMHEYVDMMRPQANGFLDALEGAIQYASGLDGHKALLALSGGAALEPARELAEAMRALFGPLEEIAQLELSMSTGEGSRSRLERLFQLAFQHDVSLSFLDRSVAPSDFSARHGRALQPGYRPMLTAHQSAQQDLSEMAGATGGVFVASHRVDEGLRQALDLIEGGYYLGFYVDDEEPMTARRLGRMTIRSTRSGVTLQHRRAYEGGRRASQATSDLIRGGIGVGAPVRKEAEGIMGNFIPLQVVLDPRDLGYVEVEDLAAATFTVHLILRTGDGAILADAYHFLTHTYPLELWKSGEVEPPTLLAWADLPAGDYYAEAVVSVPQLNRRAELRRPIAVRGSRAEEPAAAEGSAPPAVESTPPVTEESAPPAAEAPAPAAAADPPVASATPRAPAPPPGGAPRP